MTVNQLVIVRHGEINGVHITNESQHSLKQLASKVHHLFNGKLPDSILTSPALPACITGIHLSRLLSTNWYDNTNLSDGIGLRGEYQLAEQLAQLLGEHKGETALWVTHKDEAESYARLYAHLQFGVQFTEREHLSKLEPAQAYHINRNAIRILPENAPALFLEVPQ